MKCYLVGRSLSRRQLFSLTFIYSFRGINIIKVRVLLYGKWDTMMKSFAFFLIALCKKKMCFRIKKCEKL